MIINIVGSKAKLYPFANTAPVICLRQGIILSLPYLFKPLFLCYYFYHILLNQFCITGNTYEKITPCYQHL